MMEMTIHDVGHGMCAMVQCPNGARVMIDCGTNALTGWSPSTHYWFLPPHALIVQNLDADHVSDIAGITASQGLQAVVTNDSIGATELARLKGGGMSPGIAHLHGLLGRFGPGFIGRFPETGDVKFRHFRVRYPWVQDTNNLSLATFVSYRGFTALFAGDLEVAGWRLLLLDPPFRAYLRSTRFMVASHHGRENGCCDEVFEEAYPDVVVLSDDAMQYESQETTNWYARRTRGIADIPASVLAGAPRVRRVLTTRRDGTMKIITNGSRFLVVPERSALPQALPFNPVTRPLSAVPVN